MPVAVPIAMSHPFSSFVLLQGLQNAGVITAIIFGVPAVLVSLVTVLHQIYKRILGSDRGWLERVEERMIPTTNRNRIRRHLEAQVDKAQGRLAAEPGTDSIGKSS